MREGLLCMHLRRLTHLGQVSTLPKLGPVPNGPNLFWDIGTIGTI